MTKQEFDSMIEKANLVKGEDYEELYEMVIGALYSLTILDDHDGDTYEL